MSMYSNVKRKCCILFTIVVLCGCTFCPSVYASQFYVTKPVFFTAQEVMTLQTLLAEARADNKKSLEELRMTKTLLTTSEQNLNRVNMELRKLKQELTELSEISNQQMINLQNVRESYNKQLQEQAKTRRRIKAQRNAYAGLAVALIAFAYVRK